MQNYLKKKAKKEEPEELIRKTNIVKTIKTTTVKLGAPQNEPRKLIAPPL